MTKELWFFNTANGARTIVNVTPDPSKQNPYDPSADFPAGGDFVMRVAGRSAVASVTIPAPAITGGTGLSLAYDPTGLFIITPNTGYSQSDAAVTWEAFRDGVSIGLVNLVFDAGNISAANGDWYVIERATKEGFLPRATTSSTITVTATAPYPWMEPAEWFGAETLADSGTRLTEVSTSIAPPTGKVWAAHRKTTAYGASLATDFPGELVVMPFVDGKYIWTDTVQRTKGATEYCRIAIGDEVDVSGGILNLGEWAVAEKSFTVSGDPVALGAGDWSVTTAVGGFTVNITTGSNWNGRLGTEYRLIIDSEDQEPLQNGIALGSRFIANTSTSALSIAIQSVNANGTATSATKSVTPTADTPVPGTLTFDNGLQQLTFTNVLSLVEHVDGVLAVVVAPGQQATLTAKTPAQIGSPGSTSIRNGQRVNPEHFNVAYMDGRLTGTRNRSALPVTMSVGQTMLSGASRPDTETNPRSGLIDNMLGVYVTDTAPNPLSLGPLIVWRSNKGALTTPSVVDYAAVAASLPTTWPVTGGTYRNLTNVRRNLRFNPGDGINNRTNSSGGQEECRPYRWGNTSRSATNHNYDEYVVNDIGDLMLHLLAPTANVPLTVKAEILMRLDSYGWQTEQGLALASLNNLPSGSHRQSQWAGIAIHHWLRGNDAALSSLWSRYSGAPNACFRWTQDRLDFWQGPYGTPGSTTGFFETFGTAGERPAYGIRRTVVSASNPSVTVKTLITGSGGLYGDNSKSEYPGMILVNETTGEEAIISSQNNQTAGFGASTDAVAGGHFRFNLASWPASGFTVGDTVYMKPNWTPVLNQPEWRLAGTEFPNVYVAADSMSYRQSQRWFGALMFFRVMGAHRTEWQAAWDYGVAAMAGDPPGVENWPEVLAGSGYSKLFWTQYSAAILAVPQPNL
jgi:hypothetical protein